MVWITCATVGPARAALIVETAEVGQGASADPTGAITAATEAAVGIEIAEEATAGTAEEVAEAIRGTVDVVMTGATETDGVEVPLVAEIRTRDPELKMVPLRQPTNICPVAFKICAFFIHSCRVC